MEKENAEELAACRSRLGKAVTAVLENKDLDGYEKAVLESTYNEVESSLKTEDYRNAAIIVDIYGKFYGNGSAEARAKARYEGKEGIDGILPLFSELGRSAREYYKALARELGEEAEK